MSTAISAICWSLLFSAVTMLKFSKDDNNFGPYDLNVVRYEVCHGPKAHNLSLMITNLTKKADDLIGYFNLTILEDTLIEEIKVVVYSLKGNITNLLWTYKVKDPCRHFAFGSIIKVVFKTHNCIVDKQSYKFSLSFKEVTHAFLGSSFFYGDYKLKTIVISKKGNLACIIVIHRYTKKA